MYCIKRMINGILKQCIAVKIECNEIFSASKESCSTVKGTAATI